MLSLKEMPAIGTHIAVMEASDEEIHQQLIFEIPSSNRPGGQGGFDLYFVGVLKQ